MEEAERLSVYFEELGAYHYRKNREMKPQSSSSASGSEWTTELELGDEEPDTWIEAEEEDKLWPDE